MEGKSVLSMVLTTMLILIILSAVASAYDNCSIEYNPEAQLAGDPFSCVIDDILADGESVFLFFYADWCPHCHHQMPIIDELEGEYACEITFIKINVTERPDHAAEFGVSVLPAMIVISGKDGGVYVKEEISGFTEAARLREIIDVATVVETGGDADTMDTRHVAETMVGENTSQDGVTVNAKNCGGAITCACGDTVTLDYTLEDDLDCASIGLVVGATGIHIDGNGHYILGTGGEFSVGINNNGYDYVTISNLTISGFESGILLQNTTNHNNIADNSIATGQSGIYLSDSNNNEITHNYIHNNRNGVKISGGSSNTIRRNTIDSNTHYGIDLGDPVSTSSNRIYSNALCGNVLEDIMVSSGTGNRGDNICDNLDVGGNSITCHTGCDERGCVADAHPATVFKCGGTVTESCTFNSDLYCSLWNGLTVGADDVTIDGDGYRLINSFTRPGSQPNGIKNDGHNNGAVMDLTIKKFYRGIYLYNHADGNKIRGCTVDGNNYGVYISRSSNNQLLPYKYTITIPGWHSPIKVVKNNHVVNNGKGIYLSDADDNLISHSYINNNRAEGILVGASSDDNTINKNYINSNGYDGIYISYSDGNRVEDNTIEDNNDDGIYMRGSTNTIACDNRITENSAHGVYLYHSSDNTITGNIVNSNDEKGIYLNHSSDNNDLADNTANSNGDDGIYLAHSNGNILTNNTASDNPNDDGIYLAYSDNNVLTENTANFNKNNGITVSYSSGNSIEDNVANRNKWGIVVYNSSENSLTGNTASSNKKHGFHLYHSSSDNSLIKNTASKNDVHGIYIDDASYNNIRNNTINDNTNRGISLSSTMVNLIYANTITKNSYGVYLLASARNTTIAENHICDNTNPDIIDSGSNNLGWLNYCDDVSGWDDRGSSDGCMYSCGELNCTDNDEDGYYLYDLFECPIGNDCNDDDASINPGADEIYCNGRDEDCNGIDECHCPDADMDGAPAMTDTCPLGFDCDDTDPDRYPGAREINCNGVDENCDGEDQCDCTDNDGDGYALEGGDCSLGGLVDCNDDNPNIHPNAAEIYCNGVDEDCSGSDDCNCVDEDGDGYDARTPYCPTGTDCDDTRDYIHPRRDEVCYNYVDENCNGMINEGCNIDCTTDMDCSNGRVCADDDRCRCPNGELEFLVDGDVITICDPVGVPEDTSCMNGWPHREGGVVDYNEEVRACDLFEVTRSDLLAHAENARDCCVGYLETGVIPAGCHSRTDDAYDQSGLDTAINYDNLRRYIGLYIIYGMGSGREYMQDYYSNELWCGADTFLGLGFESCIGRAPAGLNYCCNIDEYEWTWCWGICWPECWGGFEPVNCYDGVHANTALLRCTWHPERAPDGWISDIDIGTNSCCFSDLPAHVSTEILSTGTCVDYSVVLTTLLRLSGYETDEVYSTRSDCPEDGGHAFNLIKLPGDSRYTLVDTVGNCNGYHPMGLPGCDTGCYYWEYENCANDNGRVSCPARSDVWGTRADGSGSESRISTTAVSASGASVPQNPNLSSVSATEGDITVTRAVYDEIYFGEIVRVNITVENDGECPVNVTVRDQIAGAMVYGALNMPEIPPGVIAPPMSYIEFSDIVPANGEKTFAYSLLPAFVGEHTHSATEVRTDANVLLYLDPQTTSVNCISDGICDGRIGENHITSPQDCPSGAKDGICNPITDGQCDNDCADGVDPDCRSELIGDLNDDGKITTADAAIALQLAASGEWRAEADADCDGQVTSLDALMILQAAAGNIELE